MLQDRLPDFAGTRRWLELRVLRMAIQTRHSWLSKVWHGSVGWPWFGGFVLGAATMLGIGEYGVAAFLLVLSAVSIASSIHHWDGPTWVKIGGIVVVAVGFSLSLVVAIAVKRDRPWSNISVAWNRYVAITPFPWPSPYSPDLPKGYSVTSRPATDPQPSPRMPTAAEIADEISKRQKQPPPIASLSIPITPQASYGNLAERIDHEADTIHSFYLDRERMDRLYREQLPKNATPKERSGASLASVSGASDRFRDQFQDDLIGIRDEAASLHVRNVDLDRTISAIAQMEQLADKEKGQNQSPQIRSWWINLGMLSGIEEDLRVLSHQVRNESEQKR